MRSADLHPGHRYIFRRAPKRDRVVTVLSTPPELRSRARVLIRFEEGVRAGSEIEVATRSIVVSLTGPAAGKVQQSQSPSQEAPVRIMRDPELGDDVTWSQSGPVIWKVARLDGRAAVIEAVLLGTPQSANVPLAELRVALDLTGGRREDPVEPAHLVNEPSGPVISDSSALAPIKPRRELDELLDDVLFSRRCLEQYGRRSSRRVASGEEALTRLREELRLRGYLADPPADRGNEYRRIRVDGRFDVILPHRPTPERPVNIDSLYFPAAKTPSSRPSGKRARSRKPNGHPLQRRPGEDIATAARPADASWRDDERPWAWSGTRADDQLAAASRPGWTESTASAS